MKRVVMVALTLAFAAACSATPRVSPMEATAAPMAYQVADETGEFVSVDGDLSLDPHGVGVSDEPTVVQGPEPLQLDVHWLGLMCQPDAIMAITGTLGALDIEITPRPPAPPECPAAGVPRVARIVFRHPVDPSNVTVVVSENMLPQD